ncbi:DUF1463 family protein [Borrelia puertoricensis]|uniref:DUF1463 family protein n=1 Tax=Borrelia puertoricensis TaxID=2756107 RepID=UPI001FF6D5AD|nr:DUF1463 family protein [Borrelia puertoricensis]UPA18615.1 DUF1463 family protein [Borrelia puertoricensis]UPA18698.1 DUF1463 family protein [Borrelia puertoricensis]UPA18736.1 DUF1463 family protein [Borrelia puertoricensis]UPA18853.1 DUF1463 family protein [Borrelia puertoricensis]UPA18890.1 DUF1463 family protein [Borrelia puertoricensis]
MTQCYDLRNIVFSIGGHEIQSGKLELTSEPTTRAVASSEDRGMPIVSFRDPRTIVFIFNIEVSIGTYDYKLLTKLSKDQFYNISKSKNERMLDLVFNDLEDIKIISNSAFFAEEPSRSYSVEAEKVTFEIRAVGCTVDN